jgi:hypothetical protein
MRKEENEKKRQKQRAKKLGEDSSEFKEIVSFLNSAIIHMTTQTALNVMKHCAPATSQRTISNCCKRNIGN